MPFVPSVHPDRRHVLHLVDPAETGPCALRTVALATERVAAGVHDVIVLGTDRDEATARRCGLRPLGHAPMPGGVPGLAQAAVARAVSAVRRLRGPRAILLHAWGERAARAARCADADATVVALFRPAWRDAAGALGARCDRRPPPAPVASATIAVGAPVQRASALGAEGLHETAPAVDPAVLPRDPGAARRAVRTRWRAAPDDFVVALVGDTAAGCNARVAMHTLALGSVAGRALQLVMHPAAPDAARLLRWSEGLRWDGGRRLRSAVILDEAVLEPWSIGAGLDAALYFTHPGPGGAPQASGLCLGWIALCGVPAIAEANAAAQQAIDDGRTGFIVSADDHTQGVGRLVRLADDRAAARAVGDAARRDALVRWSPDDLVAGIEAAYAEALATPADPRRGGPG